MIAAATIAMRDSGVQRSTAAAVLALTIASPAERRPDALAEVAEKQPREQDREEGEVAGDEEALRIDERAQTLRDAEHDSAGERAPKRSGSADHRGFEGEDELGRSGVRIEGRAHAEKGAGDRDRRQSDRGSDRVDAPRVDADEADRVGILRGRADRAPDLGAIEKGLDAAEQNDRDRHGQRGELADRDRVAERPAVVGEIADIGGERTGVGAEALEQEIVDDDREPEGREHRHEQPAARAALEHQALERPADQRHRRRDQAEAEKRLDAEAVGQNEEGVGGQHRQAAMREVDDAHDAEHEREPAGDQRVIAAEQHALNDLVEEDQGGALLSDDRLRPK